MEQILSTPQKALQLDLDAQKVGTFAEIGAGQEVAMVFSRRQGVGDGRENDLRLGYGD